MGDENSNNTGTEGQPPAPTQAQEAERQGHQPSAPTVQSSRPPSSSARPTTNSSAVSGDRVEFSPEFLELASYVGIDLYRTPYLSYFIEEMLQEQLPVPWQSFRDPKTGQLFYYDPEYGISTFQHPCVYEANAYSKEHGVQFTGCDTGSASSAALVMLEYYRLRYQNEAAEDLRARLEEQQTLKKSLDAAAQDSGFAELQRRKEEEESTALEQQRAEWFEAVNEAARRIQTRWRGYYLRTTTNYLHDAKVWRSRQAAISIQKKMRACLARLRAQKILKGKRDLKRHRAALVIQKGMLIRQRNLPTPLERENAAMRIQNNYRARLGRKRAKELAGNRSHMLEEERRMGEQNAAASKIQSAYKGRRTRVKLDTKARKEISPLIRHWAASTIQAGIRGYLDRKHNIPAHKRGDPRRQNQAARSIQHMYLSKVAREDARRQAERKAAKQLEKEEKAAKIMQKSARSHLAHRNRQLKHVREANLDLYKYRAGRVSRSAPTNPEGELNMFDKPEESDAAVTAPVVVMYEPPPPVPTESVSVQCSPQSTRAPSPVEATPKAGPLPPSSLATGKVAPPARWNQPKPKAKKKLKKKMVTSSNQTDGPFALEEDSLSEAEMSSPERVRAKMQASNRRRDSAEDVSEGPSKNSTQQPPQQQRRDRESVTPTERQQTKPPKQQQAHWYEEDEASPLPQKGKGGAKWYPGDIDDSPQRQHKGDFDAPMSDFLHFKAVPKQFSRSDDFSHTTPVGRNFLPPANTSGVGGSSNPLRHSMPAKSGHQGGGGNKKPLLAQTAQHSHSKCALTSSCRYCQLIDTQEPTRHLTSDGEGLDASDDDRKERKQVGRHVWAKQPIALGLHHTVRFGCKNCQQEFDGLMQSGNYLECAELLIRLALLLGQQGQAQLAGETAAQVAIFCNQYANLCMDTTPPQPRMAAMLLQKSEHITSSGTEFPPPDRLQLRSVTFDTLANLYYRRGKLAPAISYIQRAIRMERQVFRMELMPVWGAHLASLLSLAGKHKESLETLQHFLSMANDNVARQSDPESRSEIDRLYTEIATAVSGSKKKRALWEASPQGLLSIYYHNIAVEQIYQKLYADALRSIQQAVQLASNHVDEESPLLRRMHRTRDGIMLRVADINRKRADTPEKFNTGASAGLFPQINASSSWR